MKIIEEWLYYRAGWLTGVIETKESMACENGYNVKWRIAGMRGGENVSGVI
jgi:hypothetical protein